MSAVRDGLCKIFAPTSIHGGVNEKRFILFISAVFFSASGTAFGVPFLFDLYHVIEP
jgi:hypothetical protein